MLLIHDHLVRAGLAQRHEALLREQRRHRLALAAPAADAERQLRRAGRWITRVVLADR